MYNLNMTWKLYLTKDNRTDQHYFEFQGRVWRKELHQEFIKTLRLDNLTTETTQKVKVWVKVTAVDEEDKIITVEVA